MRSRAAQDQQQRNGAAAGRQGAVNQHCRHVAGFLAAAFFFYPVDNLTYGDDGEQGEEGEREKLLDEDQILVAGAAGENLARVAIVVDGDVHQGRQKTQVEQNDQGQSPGVRGEEPANGVDEVVANVSD